MIMKTLVILGNGFDLDLGWKTSFKDFYEAKRQKFDQYNRLSYIAAMINGEYWYNLEGYLRKCLVDVKEDKVSELNLFWQMCSNFFWEYLKENINSFVTNRNSCAFSFLESISNSVIFTFNYTNPFEREGFIEPEIHYVHGELNRAYPGTQLQLGVDKRVMDDNNLTKDGKLEVMVKSRNSSVTDNLLQGLKEAETIVFYGHSLSITDSDYFGLFFQYLIEGNFVPKNIYFVIYDRKGLQQLKENMKVYGIDFDKLLFSKNTISVVYTCEGNNSEKFQALLKCI